MKSALDVITTHRAATATPKSRASDGACLALDLLRTYKRLNWDIDAPRESIDAAKKAFRAAVEMPDVEFDQFAAIISDWLVTEVEGFGLELTTYMRRIANGYAPWTAERLSA